FTAPAVINVIATYVGALNSPGCYDRGDRQDGGPEIDVQSFVCCPMAFRKIGNTTVQYELVAPAYRTTAKNPGVPDDRLSGFGDIQAGAAFWFYNNEESRTWFAWEPFITVPTGR